MGTRVTSFVGHGNALVVGLDKNYSYYKLAEIMPYAKLAVPIIACNKDVSFPTDYGQWQPGAGPIVASVECALNRPATVVGKPNPWMLELICADWGIKKENMLVIGDSYDSDIQMADKFGCKSVLVNSGEIGNLGSMEDLLNVLSA